MTISGNTNLNIALNFAHAQMDTLCIHGGKTSAHACNTREILGVIRNGHDNISIV